jgi:predicted nucleic acid-binding protein
LIEYLSNRDDVEIVHISDSLWKRSWDLFRNRPDKGWSLTDCISFTTMQDRQLTAALAADLHFRQAGFAALLFDE